MNTSAIHQAIRLNKYPKEMEWLTLPDAPYPEGVTDLLQLCSSYERMEHFSLKYHIETDALRTILLNFIERVILKETNTAESLLGLEKWTEFDLLRKHYKLLIKIYHPDINNSSFASIQTSRITTTYNTLKKNQNATDTSFKNITLSKVPPKHFYNPSSTVKQQKSSLKSAFFVMTVLALLSLTVIITQLFEQNKPQLIAKSEGDKSTKEITPPFTNTFSMTQLQGNLSSFTPDLALQDILRDIEGYYENGAVEQIKPILANLPEISSQSDEQIQAKLETLFKITQERKMLLFDFDWLKVSGTYKGSGKFLSRYQIIGEEIWKIRKGDASITAKLINGQLSITSFKLENNDIN